MKADVYGGAGRAGPAPLSGAGFPPEDEQMLGAAPVCCHVTATVAAIQRTLRISSGF